MASALVQAFIVFLWVTSALANLSWEDIAAPTDAPHPRLSRHHSSNPLKSRDSPSCTPQTGVINVTSTDPSLNGYLAIPPSDGTRGVYGNVTDTIADALRVFFCSAGGALFDIVALNGPFQESGFPFIGGVQSDLFLRQSHIASNTLPAQASLAGIQQAVQGPPKPTNNTVANSEGVFPWSVQSTMWTIDNTNSFLPHWEDANGAPVAVSLAHHDFPPAGPMFGLTGCFAQYASVPPTSPPALVDFLFVPVDFQ